MSKNFFPSYNVFTILVEKVRDLPFAEWIAKKNVKILIKTYHNMQFSILSWYSAHM